MYNRYISNGNGGFDRHRVPSPPPVGGDKKPEHGGGDKKPEHAAPPSVQKSPQSPRRPEKPSFLKGLKLPDQMDHGDLLVLVILLLLLQEGEEDTLGILLAIGAYLLSQ